MTVDDPNNISVGLASDLVLEVECISRTGIQDGSGWIQDGSGSGSGSGSGIEITNESKIMNGTEWRYRNGNEIPSGLQAFGVSQGGGILRVYPVQLLSNASEFVCRSGQDNTATLNVTFDLGKMGEAILLNLLL